MDGPTILFLVLFCAMQFVRAYAESGRDKAFRDLKKTHDEIMRGDQTMMTTNDMVRQYSQIKDFCPRIGEDETRGQSRHAHPGRWKAYYSRMQQWLSDAESVGTPPGDLRLCIYDAKRELGHATTGNLRHVHPGDQPGDRHLADQGPAETQP